MGYRPSAISNTGPTSSISTTSIPTRRKAGCSTSSRPIGASTRARSTFNTLNFLVPGGDSPPRMGMCFDSLMVARARRTRCAVRAARPIGQRLRRPQHLHFQAAARGALARRHAADGRRRRLLLQTYKDKGHPDLVIALTHMTEAVAEDAGDVPPLLRRQAVGAHHPRHPRISRSSRKRSTRPTRSTARRSIRRSARGRTASAASSPARRSNMSASRIIGAATSPVNRGQNNFDRIRIEFYRDRQAAFEAFKKGDILYRQEFTVAHLGHRLRFSGGRRRQGRQARDSRREKRPSMQATAVNQRRERFRDPRVRRAIAMCFDFEWTQRNLFYGSYERSNSCFERSDYKADGPAVSRGTGAARTVTRPSCRRRRSAKP